MNERQHYLAVEPHDSDCQCLDCLIDRIERERDEARAEVARLRETLQWITSQRPSDGEGWLPAIDLIEMAEAALNPAKTCQD